MTDEQINIAIAEHCGWTNIGPYYRHYGRRNWEWFGDSPKDGRQKYIPDYCNDLNAMHEAEKTFGVDLDTYIDKILDLTGYFMGDILTMSARQKAEAFLKTIGKWDEWWPTSELRNRLEDLEQRMQLYVQSQRYDGDRIEAFLKAIGKWEDS
jgi:hypothetical protein